MHFSKRTPLLSKGSRYLPGHTNAQEIVYSPNKSKTLNRILLQIKKSSFSQLSIFKVTFLKGSINRKYWNLLGLTPTLKHLIYIYTS